MANIKESSRRAMADSAAGQSGERPKFEDELGDLESIVTRIDSGELSLEEAITAFERGVGLVRSLNQRLDEAEGRVELLMRGAGGSLQRRTGLLPVPGRGVRSSLPQQRGNRGRDGACG